MADNKYALEKMFNLCEKLANNEIDFVNFIKEFEIICFNDVGGNAIDNFSDGWSKASVSTLMRYVLRAYDGDVKAKQRLEVDLYIEDYDLSGTIKVVHL